MVTGSNGKGSTAAMCAAIGRAYLIPGFRQMPHLAWLLRRFKGKFYRTRYPAISFTEGSVYDTVSASS